MAASVACRPAPICRGLLRRESLATRCVLDGEAYACTQGQPWCHYHAKSPWSTRYDARLRERE
jgi:hypothetical protein